jgi:hypothetical protein
MTPKASKPPRPHSKLSRTGYDHHPLAARLRELLDATHQSARQASLGAGLDHGAIVRFLNGEYRPARDACIQMAVYFDLNPNEFFELAGYPPMEIFNLSLIDPHDFPPEVKRVAKALNEINDPAARMRVCKAILVLLKDHEDLVKGIL